MTESAGESPGASRPGPERDRMFLFDEAPDVGIGSVGIFRSTLNYDSEEEGVDDDAPFWRVSGFTTQQDDGDPPRLLMLGDLRANEEGWFVGVTATAFVYFRDPSSFDPNDHDRNARLVSALGPWISNVLYDTAAGAARTLLATNHQASIEIPLPTPVIGETEYLGRP